MAPRSRSTRTVSSLLLTICALVAVADEPTDAQKPGARVSVEKEGSKTHVILEQDVSVSIKIAPKATASCAASADYEYQQRDTFAHVTGAIENAQCAASGGDYVLAVTIRDASGELKTLEFPQQWARSDDRPAKFTHDLPIGPNVDLVNIRTRRLRCTCAETPAN